MLKTGINGKEEIIVNENHSAESLESGTLKVFGTPAMIALMEKTAWKSVQDYLEEGQGTVGTLLEIKHVSATPLGMKVYCESELTGIDGKKLIFSVKAYDETGLIGEGIHERFIVNNEKFQKKTNQKMK
ncbi:thioesterase family protein [Treponema sp. OMZ 792]|uniref:thioesterase family protein n=1 Tax=unclassified Treponema TaxID=2638727 RepID=UPI0020A51008|nr:MULTISPECIES: thioesterase family protein [unclassified Treponema]UTC76348.1 thioesterase family protein [Treponema sp. OMZ 792]UTC80348.1 thioesterase family protein [Treponema sp. OMZ 798]